MNVEDMCDPLGRPIRYSVHVSSRRGKEQDFLQTDLNPEEAAHIIIKVMSMGLMEWMTLTVMRDAQEE